MIEYRININLSVYQLSQKDILEKIKAVIKKTSINPGNIIFEVTEALTLEDMEWVTKILSSIKELGCKVALDGFGKTNSSLMSMRDLPINIVKIDKSLAADMNTDKFAAAFIKTITELATSIDVDVCVEGIEEDSQLEKLGLYGAKMAQGYYFDEPLTKGDFEEKYL